MDAGRAEEIVDPRLKTNYDVDQVVKMVEAAKRCICRTAEERPKMSEVLQILEHSGMSRANSAAELGDIFRSQVSTKGGLGPPGKSMPWQHSHESIPAKAAVDPVKISSRASEKPILTRIKAPSTPHSDQKPSSPRTPSSKLSQHNSPHGSSKHRRGERKAKISYSDMLT